MRKPIEPGCLVMVVGNAYAGFTTTAVEYFPTGSMEPFGFELEEPCWRLADYPADFEGKWLPDICAERYLIRIDDYNASADEEQVNNDQEMPTDALA